MKKSTPGFNTLAVRGGEPRAHAYGAVAMPIVCTSTYAFESSQQIADHFEGRAERQEYGRYTNPTVELAEQKISALEQSEDSLLFPSGMSAITSLVISLLKPGDHVVMVADCYRRTRQFIQTTGKKFGIEHTLVAPGDLAGTERALQEPNTRLLIAELPTNPWLRVADVPRLAGLCRERRGVKFLLDATLATPVNLQALEHGVDLVLHSATKYLAGHNDLLCGSLSGSRDLIGALREARGTLGNMPDAHSAYLLIRGLKTLGLRMRQHNQAGLQVARWLEAQPEVQQVNYPGLPSHPDYDVAGRLLRGHGSVISFLVRGDLARTSRFIDACRLPHVAPSMGGVESLIEQPALMSFYGLDAEQRKRIGIEPNLVRLSVGLEDPEDLMADLGRALRESE